MPNINIWLFNNWLTIVSIILSGLISLIISAAYYRKGNRNNLQMTVILPIVNLLKEPYSKKNYSELSNLSRNYCVRYLKKYEREALSQLVLSYKEISGFSIINVNADILFSYFEYVLRKNNIEVKPVPIKCEGEIGYYDYPPDLDYLNNALQEVLNEYGPDFFEPEECEKAIVSLFIYYLHKCYGDILLQFFDDYSLEEVLAQSEIAKNWDGKFQAIQDIKKQFLNLKVTKELIPKNKRRLNAK